MQTFVYKTKPGCMGEIYAEVMHFDEERKLVLLKTQGRVVAAIALEPGQFVAEKNIWGPEVYEIKQEPAHGHQNPDA